MNMFYKRIISAVLTIIILASTVSCSRSGTGNGLTETSGGDTTSSAPAETEGVRESVSDGLPVKDYGGYTFTIATETDKEWMVIQEESTGDVINDAIYKRDTAIEERFNIKFALITEDHKQLGNIVANSIQAGDDEIDLCYTHVVNTGSLALNDIFLNWYDIPHVDFSKPWWSKSTVDDLSIGGVCVLAIGDFALCALANTYCLYYNKTLAEAYNIAGLYEIVNEGKWSIDKVQELSKDVYSDLNTNGKADGGDLFGYISTSRSALNAFLWSFGANVLKKNSAGDLEVVYHSDRTNDIVSKLCSFFYDNTGIYINSKEATYDSRFTLIQFTDNKAVFINGQIGNSVTDLRNMKDDYGILPYPKWDEAQAEYKTMVDGSHGILCVPKTASDTERTGIITEALNAESYKTVIPAYYEVALKIKYARDNESVAMIDMIADSRVFDAGYVFDAWQGASFIFQDLIAANNNNFESTWASKSSAINAHYDKVITYFENYGKDIKK